MKRPTQAQIEAAAKAMAVMWMNNKRLKGTFEDLAEAALTAAAQVREPLQDEPAPELAREMREAAAQVGEQDLEMKPELADARRLAIQILYDMGLVGHNFTPDLTLFPLALKAYKTVNNATIERCAQVAENLKTITPGGEWAKESIAAAIRKLKDTA